ncbi:cytochrome bc complex cytochrome b subunit [Egibacter rhizosphaerae]|uniref:Cytochrome bc1 complex cytochrome b subunit n=1 Tax=Egibacter rhizosphaerae TaxID=1670831 RepID=A0A411YB07_9ACTN|nr:cytochrome b N-terminal domain-containing protein [Egibacter rhizosphaerae]QBI18391.1 cytochrome bc complex cytochrome b subunit [Egibacter rhizosphaerae]
MTRPVRAVIVGVDRRLAISPFVAKLSRKPFPRHWSYLLGEVAVVSFAILVATGIALTLFYEPSAATVTYEGGSDLHRGRDMPAAYASVVTLSNDVPGGMLLRRIHRIASHVFIGAILAHLVRVVATGAFRAPRELTHLIGVALLFVAVISGWTGHNLPFDVLAGTSLRIFYALVISIPWVGETLAQWLFAGEFPTGQMLPRMFALHALWAPLVITALLGLHLSLIARQQHTQRPRADLDGEQYTVGEPLWPWQAMTSTVLALGVAAVISLSAALLPYADLDLHAPYRIGEASNASQPDWFLFWVEGLLRLAPPLEFSALGPCGRRRS